jgi:hypothetical protein
MSLLSGENSVVVGYIPFDNRNGIMWKIFNYHVGLTESNKAIGKKIPQFCPGFNAMRGDVLIKIYPLLWHMSKKFKRKYGAEMLCIDLIAIILAKKFFGVPDVVELSPIEDRWINKQPITKLYNYYDLHKKTMDFLHSELI